MKNFILISLLLTNLTVSVASEIAVNSISPKNLITQLESVSYESDPSSTTKRAYTLEIAKEFVESNSSFNQDERRLIEANIEKLENFQSISNDLSDCSGLDGRGIEKSAIMGASEVNACADSVDRPEVESLVGDVLTSLRDASLSEELFNQSVTDGLTSRLAMKRLMPFAIKANKKSICKRYQANYPELSSEIKEICSKSERPKFNSVKEVNEKLNKKAKRINIALVNLNKSLNAKLKLYRENNPKSNALDWRRELLKIGPKDPLYSEYLTIYRNETSDELGRLTLLPPLDDRFGTPLKFDIKRISAPISGVRGLEVALPIHGSKNYKYSPTKPSIDLSNKDVKALVKRITRHQNKTEDRLYSLRKSANNKKKLTALLKINPYSMGKVLMSDPTSAKYICSVMTEIAKKDKKKELIFKTIDYVALGVGVIPVAGLGATTFVRGGSVLARAAAVGGRAVTGKMATALAIGAVTADSASIMARQKHYNSIITGIQQTIMQSKTVSPELKEDFKKAREELDKAIVEAKLMGTLGIAKLTVLTNNFIKLYSKLEPKELASTMRTVASNLKVMSEGNKYNFPTGLVLKNAKLSEAQRVSVAGALIGDISKKQIDAILSAHKVGNRGTVYNFTNSEIKQKYKILLDSGISKDDARILVKSGITGGHKEGTFSQRLLSRIPGIGPSPKKIGLAQQFKDIGEIKHIGKLSRERFQSIDKSLKTLTKDGHHRALTEDEDIPLEVVKLIEKSLADQRVGSLRGLTGEQKDIVITAREVFKDKEKTLATLKSLKKSTLREDKNGVLYFTGVPEKIHVKSGHTLVYKGTFYADKPIVSKSQVGKPIDEVPRGDKNFLTYQEGQVHGTVEVGHGISVSTDPTIAASYGTKVITYQVPNDVFKNLPAGDPTLAEKVFKYMIPDEYRVLTIDKKSMQRYNSLHKGK